MKKRVIDGVEVHRGSDNVFADLGLPDADKLKIKAGLVVEIRKVMRTLQEFERLAQRLTKSIAKTIRAIDRTIASCEASNERMARLETRMKKNETMAAHKELMASLPEKRRRAIYVRAAEILKERTRKPKGKITMENVVSALAKSPRHTKRRAVLDELVKEAQKLNMGY